MPENQAVIRSWQDEDPAVGHDNAIIWRVLNGKKPGEEEPQYCMNNLRGITRHALQGRQDSDHHKHDNAEQCYYILSGSGEVLIGDKKYPVQEGSVTYFPPKVPHQLLGKHQNDWIEHLVITCQVDGEGSEPRVVNWRDVSPICMHGSAVNWSLLEPFDRKKSRTNQPCLLGMRGLGRQALTKGKSSNYHKHDNGEQSYYILEGNATMVIDDQLHQVSEGDAVYLPPGTLHNIINENYDGWMSYLIISS